MLQIFIRHDLKNILVLNMKHLYLNILYNKSLLEQTTLNMLVRYFPKKKNHPEFPHFFTLDWISNFNNTIRKTLRGVSFVCFRFNFTDFIYLKSFHDNYAQTLIYNFLKLF